MCNNIFWRFQDCGHHMLQNIFHCHVVRRCRPTDDMVLEKPVFLPQLPKVPAGMLDCRQIKLFRGKPGRCPDCEQNGAAATADVARLRSVSLTGVPSSSSQGQDHDAYPDLPAHDNIMLGHPPSPEPEALQGIRNSLLRLSLLQQPTSPEDMCGTSDTEESPLAKRATRMASISKNKMPLRESPDEI